MTNTPSVATGEVWVVLNPASRCARRPGLADRIRDCFATHGMSATVHLTSSHEDGARIAREAVRRGVPAVIAAGGDGTINEVVQGLAGSQTALGIIPLGTGNVLAGYLKLPERNIERACEVVASGHVRLIDLGQAGDHYFAIMAGIGLDAQVVQDLALEAKAFWGKLAFVARFAKTALRQRPRQFKLKVIGPQPDEVDERLWAVMICNTVQYTWRLRLSPNAHDDDGLLDVIAIVDCPRARLLLIALMFFINKKFPEEWGVIRWQIQRMQIAAAPPVLWHVEGEVMGTTPVTVQVRPRSLRVLVPTEPDPRST